MDNPQNEPARVMMDNESFQPFLDRGHEGTFSRILKWVVNFLFAMFHFIFNIPVFLVGILAMCESAYKSWFDPTYTTHWKPIWFLYAFVIMLIIDRLVRKTQKNMVSPEVELIWAVNFFGKIKNRFYSLEYSQKISRELDDYVDKQMKVRERELLKIIGELEDSIYRLGQAVQFPSEIIHSLSRLVSYFTDALLYKDLNLPRYSFENMLDHLLSELASNDLLRGEVQQASIMLLDDTSHLRIYGSLNLHENVRRSRRIALGNEFAGKVTEKGKVVWLDDLSNEKAIDYGFDPDKVKDFPYSAIMGRPIKVTGQDYKPFGIVVIHFKDKPTYTEYERKYIVNTIELYCQLIIAMLRVHQVPRLNGVYQILGSAEVEVAASNQTNLDE